jgi:hypothetical protein
MYEAIIAKVVNVRAHPNADRLNLGTVNGYQIVIGKDVKEGTLGVFFSEDGALTEGMLYFNNLYSDKEKNMDKTKKGFFGNHGRIRVQRFRGAKSEGFWTELEALSWTGVDLSSLSEEYTFNTLNGHKVCQKYYTPATQQAMSGGGNKQKKKTKAQPKKSFPYFKEHWKTLHLRKAIKFIPEGALITITEKNHGTSGRTGRLLSVKRLSKFKRLCNQLLYRFNLQFIDKRYEYVTGSRRKVINTNLKTDDGYYLNTTFRTDIHNRIKSIGLRKGETLYYEIVGFDNKGKAIMASQGIQDKKLKKQYGDKMVYSYGCTPDGEGSSQYRVLVYRITHTLHDGTISELPWHQVEQRCAELGIETVPVMTQMIYDGDRDKLLSTCEYLSSGSSVLDSSHIKEGVVVRVDAPGVESHLKYKSFEFCELEGHQKSAGSYVDLEEIS